MEEVVGKLTAEAEEGVSRKMHDDDDRSTIAESEIDYYSASSEEDVSSTPSRAGTPRSEHAEKLRRAIVTDKMLHRAMKKAHNFMDDHPEAVESEVGEPPVSRAEMKRMATDKGFCREQVERNPTLMFELFGWCEKIVVAIYKYMKDSVSSIIRSIHSLTANVSENAEMLNNARLLSQHVVSMMQKFLGATKMITVELEDMKGSLLTLSKGKKAMQLKSKSQCVAAMHQLKKIFSKLGKVQNGLLTDLEVKLKELTKNHQDQLDEHKAQLERFRARQQASIWDTVKDKATLGLALGSGGSLILGGLALTVLIVAGIVTGGVAIGICAGVVALGAIGGGALGYMMGCHATEQGDMHKALYEELCNQLTKICVVLNALKNALDMVNMSIRVVQTKFDELFQQIKERLLMYDSTKEAASTWTDEWLDILQIYTLHEAVLKDDTLDDPFLSMMGMETELEVDISGLLKGLDDVLRQMADFEEVVEAQIKTLRIA